MIISIILGIVCGWLFGIWLNKQAYDELKIGNKWFAAIIWTSAIVFLFSVIFLRKYQGFDSLIGAIFFLATLAYTSYRKSEQPVKKRK